ncbi:T9SS type A sorting domain-containing protein, partial [bacterium]|nr:T9SS type A sorting domain-containing protein [bacterium]
DFLSLVETQLEIPRKEDGSLPEIEFMHPSVGSALKDAGVDVGLPYWGNAPDLGAFEMPGDSFHLNKLPVVSISFPTKGTSFTTPATVEVSIEAFDPDGKISKVELFNGSKKIAESTAEPYSFTLKDLPAGTYSFRAVATDDLKASSVSSTLEVSVVAYNQKSEFFNLYPNPNNGRFTVDFSSLVEAESFMLTVVDLIGNTVFREEMSANESTRQFDLSHLNSGIYILMIAAGQILLTQKLILNQLP